MDNASKALIMAGGILIGVMLISLGTYMLTIGRGVSDSSERQIKATQIESFNNFFIKYDSVITGLDVYNILGKIDDINSDENRITDAPIVDENSSVRSRNQISKTEQWDPSIHYRYDIVFGNDGFIQSVKFSRI